MFVSEKNVVEVSDLDLRSPLSFALKVDSFTTVIVFVGASIGHEFNSLVLAKLYSLVTPLKLDNSINAFLSSVNWRSKF